MMMDRRIKYDGIMLGCGRKSLPKMLCSKCGSKNIGVCDSRPAEVYGEAAIGRSRKCKDCDHRWKTVEIPVDQLEPMVADRTRHVRTKLVVSTVNALGITLDEVIEAIVSEKKSRKS